MKVLSSVVFAVSIAIACNGLAQIEPNRAGTSDTYDEARRYIEGDGVKKDLDKATHLYSQALDAGDYRAALCLYDLARRFQFGAGAQKDLQRAKAIFKIYQKRCTESSDLWAMLALGLSYKDGVGTTPQYRTAISLLLKVVDKWQGDPRAKDARKAAARDLADAANRLQWFEGGEQLSHPERVDWGIVLAAFSKAASLDEPLAEVGLGYLYERGHGVAKDLRKAVEWYRKAAEQGDRDGQLFLGIMYEQGLGVLQNYVEALKWYTIAAISGEANTVQLRDNLARRISRRDLSEAQQLAKRFLDERSASPAAGGSHVAPNVPTVSGTGFFISEDGYLLTNHHVIAGASKIVVRTADEELPASLISVDASNDLALLKVSGKFTPLPLGNVNDVALGDSVMTIGFPNIQVQGLSPKLTRGEISSLSGAQDDPRIFQISVPVQPGNSGGALIDTVGNAIGVATAQLDALTALKISGSLPQNVNYAIKISYARLLVDTVPHLTEKLPSPRTDKPNSAEIIDRATHATALILVWAKR